MTRPGYKEGIPSVTELLRFAGYYDSYPTDRETLDRVYRRGRFVDQCCALLAQGKVLDDRTMDVARREEWVDYVRPFVHWCSDHKIEFVSKQGYVFNPWESYQGTYDLLLKVDGALTLIDIKTGTCPKCTALQTSGYVMALRACNGQNPEQRLGLQLEPGKYTEHWYKDFRDFDRFRLLARFFYAHGPLSKEYR